MEHDVRGFSIDITLSDTFQIKPTKHDKIHKIIKKKNASNPCQTLIRVFNMFSDSSSVHTSMNRPQT